MPAKVRIPTADSLARDRLTTLLGSVWAHRLALVVAPAGSGKTTLLAGFAAGSSVPVAWYRAESWDSPEDSLLSHLEAAFAAAMPGLRRGWRSVADASAALEAHGIDKGILIVDDLHELEGTPAEATFGRFIDYAPPGLVILVGSRIAPTFNLTRLRVAGELLEIGTEELRFRAWEVERLFREYYQDPVQPSDLAVLARRTEGWAAGLQLFHLATRGKSPEERRRILTAAGTRTRLVSEYLTRNVLGDLPDSLRSFLIETCVLTRLSGALCDRLLGHGGSAPVLDELARRQIFTVAVDEADGTYRYHEVLRVHLDRMLVEKVGEAEARRRHELAGALLEEDGASAEALAAYCRAEAWPSAQRLLGGQGERLTGGSPTWVEALPPAIVRHDPWLRLASARRARAEGRWVAALDAYGRAEVAFGGASTALVCRDERRTLSAWLDPVAVAPDDWTAALRSGLVREPLAAARQAERALGPRGALVRGLLELAAGEVREARIHLAASRGDTESSPVLKAICDLASGVAGLLAGDLDAGRLIDDAVEQAERAGVTWLARVGGAVRRIVPGPGEDGLQWAAAAFAEEDDGWGRAILALLEAWSPRVDPDPDRGARPLGEVRLAAAEQATEDFRRLGAGVLEAWGRSLAALALAQSGSDEARDAALAAESFGRATGTPIARLLAYLALAASEPGRATEYRDLAASVRSETGLVAEPTTATGWEADEQVDRTSVGTNGASAHNGHGALTNSHGWRVRTLGGFQLERDGRAVRLDGVKPRARAVLRLLALHVEGGVHREVICEALWPDADALTGGRSLQVAISALRAALAGAAGADSGSIISRDGDAYRLSMPPESVDIWRFERAILDGRAAADGPAARAAFQRALMLYGDLLPEDGPTDWVVDSRERCRASAVEAARGIAESAMRGGEFDSVVRACQAGLSIDRYQDALWRLLIEARELAGDAGAAMRDRREYESILDGMGVGAG